MTIHYACTCGHTGSYDAATAPKTDAASLDAKHHKACSGTVLTGTDEAALGRIRERVAA